MSTPIVAKTIGLVGIRRGLSHLQFHTLCRLLVVQQGRGALAGVEVAHRSNDGWSGADFSRITRWMSTIPKLVVHDSGRPMEEAPVLSAESPVSWTDFSIESPTLPSWNREIVEESDVVLACPAIVVDEDARSRTWAAIRHARSLEKLVIIVFPNGTIEVDGQRFYLVKETNDRGNLWVFLSRDPRAEGYEGVGETPIILETLPLPDRREAVRPVIGRSKSSSPRYREFGTIKELRQAGFENLGPYRVCDSWEDYHFPWEAATPDESESNDVKETNSEIQHMTLDTLGEVDHPVALTPATCGS